MICHRKNIGTYICKVQIGADQGHTKLSKPTSQMHRASGSEYREQMRSVLPHFSSRSLLEPQVLTPMTYRVEQEQATSSAAMLSVALNGPCPACRILFDAGASEPRNEIVADADGPHGEQGSPQVCRK